MRRSALKIWTRGAGMAVAVVFATALPGVAQAPPVQPTFPTSGDPMNPEDVDTPF